MTSKVKKKPTPNQIRYNQEWKRIRQFMRRAEKRGYKFKEDILPNKKPSRITKQMIAELEYLTPDRLYAKAKFTTEFGEVISGTKARIQERSKSAKKGVERAKQRKKAEQDFWTDTSPKTKPTQPETQPTTPAPAAEPEPTPEGENFWLNFYHEYIVPLEQLKITEYYQDGKGRQHKYSDYMYSFRKDRYHEVVNDFWKVTNLIGKDAFGWILEDHISELQVKLEIIQFSYEQREIDVSTQDVISAFNSAPVSTQQQQQIFDDDELISELDEW